ncbi:delta(1)-pyrroline-2-carboxylate reductase family protein [Roseateles violae]|uniref:Delta(1)-pyrroline-2-carboxylate reductase family protein n=1 Tax=Roseateles violae TaxID=3058042 RepID=A0ABT8DZ15_9BURK|nr:delta(1)-pyrroline-2-carboxylate reductase family protein [Pelomonas sp. PFR6]MDN3922833.1 delta(1)-pyrroline-2-carboxylate reductase family protein [Pelomonas sp. PFR6]
MRVLDAAATAAALPWAPLLAEIAAVCREHAAGNIDCPPRLVLPLPEDGTLLVMPARSAAIAVTKLVTVHPHNAARGRPTIAGEVIVIDGASGERLALLDGPTLTARRTAAVSLLAVELMATRPPREVLVVGSGAQALAHVEALRALHPQARICVQARRPVAIEGAETIAAAQQAQRRWDLLIAATSSREPVLADGVGEGALVIGVGAFRHDMVELPPALVAAAEVFVDDPEGARAEAGDLLAAGLTGPLPSLEELVLGRRPATDGRTRVFKSVGCARWDLAAARLAVRVPAR